MSTLYLKKPEEIEIFINPFRSKIIRIMKEKNRPMTVKEVADSLGVSPAKAYYHIKKLESIGVLYIKYTKIVNGIVAKYYDFSSDSIALAIEDRDTGSDLLRSKTMAEYGNYFDEAKQKFLDLFNHGTTMSKQGIFITRKDSFFVDPDRADAMYEELKKVLEKYRSSDGKAISYSLFLFMIQNGEK